MYKLGWDWFSSHWNILDIISLLLFAAAVVMRLLSPDVVGQVNARTALSFNSIVIFIRFAHYYTIHRAIGPKIIMLYRMIPHVVVFLALVLLCVCGFGVAYQGLLFNSAIVDSRTFPAVFFRYSTTRTHTFVQSLPGLL